MAMIEYVYSRRSKKRKLSSD